MEPAVQERPVRGHITKACEFAGLRLVDRVYSAHTKVPKHSHQGAVFCVGLTGRCSEVFAGKVRQYEALTVQFLPPDQCHSLDFSFADTRAFSIDIATCWIERAREFSLRLDDSVHAHGGLLSGLMMKAYDEFRHPDSASPVAIQGLTMELLAAVSRDNAKLSDRRPQRWLARAEEFLRESFAGHVTLAQVASAAGVHPVHLAQRAYAQSERFGAAVMIAHRVVALRAEGTCYGVSLDDGTTIRARTVVIATGARYRRPALANLTQFEGAGVYYHATDTEGAQVTDRDEVIVVGGANSAGQAAVYLARKARRVHMLVRADGLAGRMSHYLSRRVGEEPAIHVRTGTEIVALEGNGRLERVRWRDDTGATTCHEIKHVFLMTGADPNTDWLAGCLALDSKGFIKTGGDVTQGELAAAQWSAARSPYLLETSLRGVFAVGDVRSGNIRRVASAVGEGSIVLSFVTRALAE
jgi:thioredoxin reductase